MKSSNGGFTLIEVIAVVAIMALLACTAVFSLASTSSKHRFEASRDELEKLDGLVRSAARQSGDAHELVFDLSAGRVLWKHGDEAEAVSVIRMGGDRLSEVRTIEQRMTNGTLIVDISRSGYSQSYAVRLADQNQSNWMVVSGLTGRVSWINDEKTVDAIFEMLASPSTASQSGTDAH